MLEPVKILEYNTSSVCGRVKQAADGCERESVDKISKDVTVENNILDWACLLLNYGE